jgi:asparaginyl-tRNA synthetase
MLTDGSCHTPLQLVVEAGSIDAALLERCTTGASISATGTLKQSLGRNQSIELAVHAIEVLGDSDIEKYPLQKKSHSWEFLREIAHLRPRTNTFGAVFRVRNVLAYEVHQFFQSQGFMWVHTPIITSSDCEGAGAMFQVTTLDPTNPPKTDSGKIDYSKDFFGKRSHLTVSGQLEGEMFATAFRHIYTFGPTFRAENSHTSRHLSEFWMIEPEMAFADLQDGIVLADALLKHLFHAALKQCSEDLSFLEQFYKNISLQSLEQLANSTMKTITYTDAIAELEKEKEHERFLTEQLFKGPVAVCNYPKEIKAFYMRSNDDNKTVAAVDILVPGIGEIIGGSQREERLDYLEKRMRELDIPTSEMQWYLDSRRFGTVPHVGFGLGFERLVQYITGMTNIRDVIPFPRTPNSLA